MEGNIAYIILVALLIAAFFISRSKFVKSFRRLKYTYIIFFAYAVYFAIDIFYFYNKDKYVLSILSLIMLIASLYLAIANVRITHGQKSNS